MTELKFVLMIAPAIANGTTAVNKGPPDHADEIADHHRLPSSEVILP